MNYRLNIFVLEKIAQRHMLQGCCNKKTTLFLINSYLFCNWRTVTFWSIRCFPLSRISARLSLLPLLIWARVGWVNIPFCIPFLISFMSGFALSFSLFLGRGVKQAEVHGGEVGSHAAATATGDGWSGAAAYEERGLRVAGAGGVGVRFSSRAWLSWAEGLAIHERGIHGRCLRD
jgi:hypothetical protein